MEESIERGKSSGEYNPFVAQLKELKRLIIQFKKNKGAILGFIILIFIGLIAIFAPYIVPHDPNYIDATNRLRAPDSEFIFGTDGFGRDILSRLIYGTRLSLKISFLVVISSTIIGTILGLVTGYYKRVDNILMRVLDGFMAFPSIILNIGIMAALGPSVKNVVIALTFSYSPRMARIVRSSVLVQKNQQYVEAAKVLGNNDMGILLHILPNCIAPIIVQSTMIFAFSMLSEASLSFLGVGVPPEIPSWGNILSQGRVFIRRAPWITYYSGLIISIAVLSVNMFGDGLRDALDPKLRK